MDNLNVFKCRTLKFLNSILSNLSDAVANPIWWKFMVICGCFRPPCETFCWVFNYFRCIVSLF